MLRAFLKKQGAAEDFFYYGPRTGWGYRHMKDETVALLDRACRPASSSASSRSTAPAQAKIAWNDLSDVGRRARKLAHGTPALLWLDVPLDGTGANDFKALLKAKLGARVG